MERSYVLLGERSHVLLCGRYFSVKVFLSDDNTSFWGALAWSEVDWPIKIRIHSLTFFYCLTGTPYFLFRWGGQDWPSCWLWSLDSQLESALCQQIRASVWDVLPALKWWWKIFSVMCTVKRLRVSSAKKKTKRKIIPEDIVKSFQLKGKKATSFLFGCPAITAGSNWKSFLHPLMVDNTFCASDSPNPKNHSQTGITQQ